MTRTGGAGRAGVTVRGRRLIGLAALLSLGHHLDHVVRGDHTGWPVTGQVTPFTYSLAVYPLILLGVHLSRNGRVGAGYWALLSGLGTVFLLAVHLGPAAIEPPGDILGGYPTALGGVAAFGWLLALLAALAASFLHETGQWRRARLLPVPSAPGVSGPDALALDGPAGSDRAVDAALASAVPPPLTGAVVRR